MHSNNYSFDKEYKVFLSNQCQRFRYQKPIGQMSLVTVECCSSSPSGATVNFVIPIDRSKQQNYGPGLGHPLTSEPFSTLHFKKTISQINSSIDYVNECSSACFFFRGERLFIQTILFITPIIFFRMPYAPNHLRVILITFVCKK